MNSATVLIVDDDAKVAASVSEILAANGLTPAIAANGAAARETMDRLKPDVVLVDLVLPDIDGIALIEALYTRHPHTEFVIITGHATKESAIAATNLGAFAILQKPYDPDHLLLVVRRALEKRQAETALTESELRFRNVFEHSTDGMLIVDASRHTFMFCNAALYTMLGYASDEQLEISIPEGDNVPAEGTSPVVGQIETLDETMRTKTYVPLQRKDGTLVYAHIRSSTISFGGQEFSLYVFRDVTEQKHAQDILRYRSELETHIAAAATLFIHLSSENIDTTILQTLGDIGAFCGVHRSYMFLLDDEHRNMSNAHEWCAPGVESMRDRLQNVPCDAFPWWMDKLNRHESIHIPRVGDLPAEAAAEKRMLEEQGIRSLLVVPMVWQYTVRGFIGFDAVGCEHPWSHEEIVLLETLAHIFTQALDRAKTEEELKNREEWFRLLFQCAPDAYFLIDLQGCFVDGNEAAERMLGYAKNDIVGKNILQANILKHADLAKVASSLAISAQGESTGPSEYTLMHRDGHEVAVEILSHPLTIKNQQLMLGIARDISERKRAEKVLRENEERYRLVVNQTGQIIYDYDIATGKLGWIGPIEMLTGFTHDEFQLVDIKVWEEMIHPDDRTHAISLLRDTMKTGAHYDVEYRFRRKDGTYLQVEDNGAYLRDAGGNIYRMVGSMKDITERKRAEAQLNERMVELEEFNRVAVGRELKMIELKEKIDRLRKKCGEEGE